MPGHTPPSLASHVGEVYRRAMGPRVVRATAPAGSTCCPTAGRAVVGVLQLRRVQYSSVR